MKEQNEKPSITMRVFILGYILAMFVNEVTIKGVNASLLCVILASFLTMYTIVHRSLSMRTKALIVTCITIVSIVVSLVINEPVVTMHLIQHQVLQQTIVIMFLSLKGAFCMQLTALIVDPYITKQEQKIFKATNDEFVFAETMILVLITCCIAGYYFGDWQVKTFMLDMFQGYVIVKLLTTIQTKVIEAIKGV